jgi:hypothetical protein
LKNWLYFKRDSKGCWESAENADYGLLEFQFCHILAMRNFSVPYFLHLKKQDSSNNFLGLLQGLNE